MSIPEIKIGLVSNLWSRMMHFKLKGDIEEGHTHTFDHLTLLASGSVEIEANGNKTTFIAPNMIYIKADVFHKITALQDNTVAFCIHALRDATHGDIISEDMIPNGVTPSSVFSDGTVMSLTTN